MDIFRIYKLAFRMNDNNIYKNRTDLRFWNHYWSSKQNIADQIITEKWLYSDIFKKIFKYNSDGKFVEIGGFPGLNAIWFSKYLGYNSSIVDIYIDNAVLKSLIKKNKSKEIIAIQKSIFDYNPDDKYDIVMSSGLVEHFDDLEAIIDCHYKLLNYGGIAIICVPNFLGLNGLLQKLIDKKNIDAHNLSAMDHRIMISLLKESGFKDIKSKYYGRFGVWIENETKYPKLLIFFMRLVNMIGSKINIFGMETKAFSPYSVFIAKKI